MQVYISKVPLSGNGEGLQEVRKHRSVAAVVRQRRQRNQRHSFCPDPQRNYSAMAPSPGPSAAWEDHLGRSGVARGAEPGAGARILGAGATAFQPVGAPWEMLQEPTNALNRLSENTATGGS